MHLGYKWIKHNVEVEFRCFLHVQNMKLVYTMINRAAGLSKEDTIL